MKETKNGSQELKIKIDEAIHRDFKSEAVKHRITMATLFLKIWSQYKKSQKNSECLFKSKPDNEIKN